MSDQIIVDVLKQNIENLQQRIDTIKSNQTGELNQDEAEMLRTSEAVLDSYTKQLVGLQGQ